jgi:uncharacterized protein
MLDEHDDRFYVGASAFPGAGDGLFSRVPLRAGDRLTVIGVTIRADSVADRCTRYADEHKYRVGDTLVIPVGFGAMVNHSAVPNMAKVVDASGLYLEALRDIDANEELSFAYDPRALDRFGLTRA